MVTSGRIDISSPTSMCDTSGITISRSKPAILEGHINAFAWTSFCNKMDEALKPLEKAKKTMSIGIACTMGLGFLLFIIGFITFGMGMKSLTSFDDDFVNGGTGSNSGGSPFLGMIPSLVGMVVMIIGLTGFTVHAGKQVGPVQTGMRAVCEETTALHPRVSFHVREEMRFWGYQGGGYGNGNNNGGGVTRTNYIECYVADIEAGASPNVLGNFGPSAPPFAVAEPEFPAQIFPGAVSLGVKSPEERMRELDNMKNLLTENEYEAKRAEILSDV